MSADDTGQSGQKIPDGLPDGLEEAGPARSPRSKSTPDGRPHFSGHRDRLRERFATAGGDALPDYELLELVLMRSIPRRDVKPLAKELITRFGSFPEVVGASEERLVEVKGIGTETARDLKILEAAAKRVAKGAIGERTLLLSWKDVIAYCRAAMAFNNREEFRILFLNKRNRLIADEVQGTGTVDHVPVYIREVVRRALELSATAIILVHNHPSGDPTPSTADIRMTLDIQKAAKPLGITLHDHIIIGREGHASFRGLKLLED